MQVVILIAFILALVLQTAQGAALPWPLLLGGIGAYLGVAAGLSWLLATWSLRAMNQPQADLTRILRRRNLLYSLILAYLLGGLAGLTLLGLGPWTAQGLLGRIPLVGKVLLVLPFIVAVLLTWVTGYRFYRELRSRLAQREIASGAMPLPVWTFSQYLGYNIRHQLLFILVPLSLMILAQDLLTLAQELLGPYLGPLLPATPAWEYLLLGLRAAVALGAFFVVPPLIVGVWQTEPLEQGALRADLEDLCRRLRLRYRDILVWRSAGAIANAGVMGLAGSVRYILLSDALLERLDPQEIKSIFAHEAGHVIGHHLFYSALFAIVSVTACSLIAELLAWRLRLGDLATQIISLLLLGLVWLLAFGWLSRRFERHSDVVAAWVPGNLTDAPGGEAISPEGAALFAKALHHVAQLGGIAPSQFNWRHGSINSRIRYILWLGSSGGTRRAIDRTVRRAKGVLWLSLAALAVATAVVVAQIG